LRAERCTLWPLQQRCSSLQHRVSKRGCAAKLQGESRAFAAKGERESRAFAAKGEQKGVCSKGSGV